MYLRTTTRRAADGTLVRYLQFAHNVPEPPRIFGLAPAEAAVTA